MKIQRLLALFFLIFIADANRFDQFLGYRQQRNIDLMNWRTADTLFNQLYLNNHRHMDTDFRPRVPQRPSRARPVEGPINIEQLPAMLAARNVQRYPYSQRDDPAMIGR